MSSKIMIGAILALALAAICFAPAADADGQIIHEDSNILEVGTSEEFKIKYTLADDQKDMTITYDAKVLDKAGNTMSDAVSPSTGDLDDKELKTLTVVVPTAKGDYTLVVEFKLKVTGDDSKTVTSEQRFSFKAVEARTLTINLKADDVSLNLDSFGVFFYIDGQKMEDSFTTISLDSSGTGSVSYDWIADPSVGAHTFCVKSVGGSDLIQGLGDTHTFYVGDNDYTWAIVLAFVILILLIIEFIRILRKPIKNYGKPKSRR